MASISVRDIRMSFKLDTGEVNGDKPVYKNISLGGIRGNSGADDLASAAEAAGDLVKFSVEEITLRRADILEL
ncbi:MAG: hypothetical protein LBR87_07720 [Synergistaceae bacterium]|jgi:hypothetical protein|nr:hypothetical protein [Synergistaceae bacterium]